MKKNLLISGLILIAITFTGCFNSIFYEINKDVAPAELTVNGNIRTIVRYTVDGNEYLVTLSDDGIKYKPVDITSDKYSQHGCWKDYSVMPEGYTPHKYKYYDETHSGEQLLKLVGDSEYLYLLSVTYTKDVDEGFSVPDSFNLYVTKIPSVSEDKVTWTNGTWQKIENASELFLYFKPKKSDYTYSAFNIFSTNAVQTGHRKAYIRSGGFLKQYSTTILDEEYEAYANPVYYELNGTELTPITVTPFEIEEYSTDSKSVTESKDARIKYGCNSAVWINNGVQFFSTTAAETNETYSTDASIVYFGVNNYVYYALASSLNTHVQTFSAGSAPINCFAVCADTLLIGRGNFHADSTSSSGGITKANLVNGLPKIVDDEYEGTVSFTTNAEIKLKTAYLILTLLNEDPAKDELDSNLFSTISFIGTGTATTATYNNVGLWAYYPGRGNWNCE